MRIESAPLLLVPFSEVRHWQPDDCLHYEPVRVRGALHDWTIPMHRHEGLHQFQFLERGSATATVDGRDVEIAAPAIILVAPGAVHGFRYLRDSVGHQMTIPTATLLRCLQDAERLQTSLATSFLLDRAVLGDDDARRGSILFSALAEEFAGTEPGRVPALLAQATLLAVWFLRHADEQRPHSPPRGMRDALVRRFRVLLDAHYREQRPVSFYAEELQVTADHLSRTCKAVTGQRTLDLVHGRVVLEARRLLAYSALGVSEIAEALGYADPSYFSRFFTRAVGASPTAYRESVANGVRMQ